MLLLLCALVAVAGTVLGSLNAYQAITGRRVSKKPSQRTDAQMRQQSAVAAVALLGMSTLILVVLVLIALLGG